MLLSFFEKNYFLLAIAWAVINSLWQGAICWFAYKMITSTKKVSALIRHHLSLFFFTIIFGWFIYTVLNGYAIFNAPGYNTGMFFNVEFNYFIKHFSACFYVFALLYLSVVLFNGIRLAIRLNSALRFRDNNLLKAPFDFRIFASQTALHLGIKRKVELWLSDKVQVPCVAGFFKPIILLPFTIFNQLNAEQAEAIILHELAHVKRNDYLVNLVQSVIDVILFFNPFALLLSKEIRKEREKCCDDWVINYKYDKQSYAAALLHLEKIRQVDLKLLPAATGEKGKLLQRIKRLFYEDPHTEITGLQKFKLSMIAIALLPILFFCMPDIYKVTPVSYTSAKTILPASFTEGNQKWTAELVNTRPMVNNKPMVKRLASVENGVTSTPGKLNKQAQKINKQEREYSVALVNNELLVSQNESENVASMAVKVDTESKDYLIKIEIEQSGSRAKTSYVFEYNKSENGVADIKPLLILNKNKLKPAVTKALKKVSDKKSVSKKKRITS